LARLFTWLKTAGVKRICDLRVPDSFSHPVSDEDIERLLGKQFNVWGFDWRKLDLDIEVVRTAAEDVEKLHLYSSGNWPVLFCWATCGTCQKLTKVCSFLMLMRL
jgi:hypothetical protein